MGTLNEDLTGIKAVEDKLTSNKVAKFAYTDHAYNNPLTEADGVTVYNVNNEQNIPVADATILNVNETILSKGWRSQASSITRMLMNHFLGRISYNLNKVNDNVSSMLATFISHLGTANGIATLDANGRIPFAQLPESAIEYEGNWNANTNTPHLVNGTGTKGDFYICNVAGTCDFGAGEIAFLENDRVIYDGAVWSKLSAGDVRTVNGVSPDSSTGNVQLTKGDLGLGSVANTGDSANVSSGGTTKFTTGGAYNLLTSLAPIFSSSIAYTVGSFVTYQNTLYECTTAHSAGAWNVSHFTARSVEYIINTYIFPSLAPAFSTSTAYAVGNFVMYQNKLYRCIIAHSAGAWNTSHFSLATLNDVVSAGSITGTLPIAHGGTGKTTATDAINNFINSLPTSETSPQDADYYVAQYAGGGTTNNTYIRRSVSALWNYIKSKITGAISSVVTSNLTANRMVVTDANGKMTVASRIGVTGVKGNSETSYRTGDVNITKADIGLGSVANTGDSATPVSGGTTKFTTGGAYNFFGGDTNAKGWLSKVFSWALGKTWTKGTGFGSNSTFNEIAYDEGLFVACSSNVGIWWSVDGKAWTKGTNLVPSETSIANISFSTVVYKDGLWVAGTNSQGVWYSTDGKAWSRGQFMAGSGSNTTSVLSICTRASGNWVLGTYSSGLYYSANGKQWYQLSSTTNSYTFDYVYVNGFFYIACSREHGLWWSDDDGNTWTQGTGSNTNYSFRYVTYAKGIYVASSNSQGMWYSTNGKAWTQGTGNNSAYSFGCVIIAESMFVACSSSHGIWYSTDGKAWTQAIGDCLTFSFNSVAYANGVFVACSSTHGSWRSADGISWVQTKGSGVYTQSITFGHAIYANNIWVMSATLQGLWWSDYSNIAWQ